MRIGQQVTVSCSDKVKNFIETFTACERKMISGSTFLWPKSELKD